MTYREPDWTAENQNRKRGDTDFVICGWCRHTSGGTYRHNCALSATCALMKPYGREKLEWDSVCTFKDLGQTDLASIINSKCYELDGLSSQIKHIEEQIKTIVAHIPERANSPPLPSNRIQDYDEGEVVYVAINGKWERGIVVHGYRSHDGCVSYCLDNIPKATNWGCGAETPCVLKEWEYKYFARHPDDYSRWKNTCINKEYNGEHIVLPNIPTEARA